MSYPLGSFPRFGHQERWAQERRQRAIVNSIATRQARKRDRVVREGSELLAFKEVLEWGNQQLKGVDMPPEFVSLGESICLRMTRTIEHWNQDKDHRKSYRKQIDEVVSDTKQVLDRANGSGDQFVARWATTASRIATERWREHWAGIAKAGEYAPVYVPPPKVESEFPWKAAIYWGIWALILVPLALSSMTFPVLLFGFAVLIWLILKDL